MTKLANQPFSLHQWEKRFIRGAIGTDGDAALSVPRGNGKSTLIAAITSRHGDKLADRKRWSVQDSTNRATIRSDSKRMHGLAPRLLISDELAQWELGKIDKALATLQTSMGKIPYAKAVWIGTQADQPDHPFERIMNRGVEYSQVHSTPLASPPFQKRSWHKANPSLLDGQLHPQKGLLIRASVGGTR